MDILGKVIKEFLRQNHENSVKNALGLAGLLQKEGLKQGQIEEMLCASEFESKIVSEAMGRLFPKGAE